jgi:hypothetical protein
MNSITEARELTYKYLEPILKKHGFTIKLGAGKEAKIERKTANGTDILGLDLLNYNPSFQIRYAFSKINIAINDILLRFQESSKLPLQVDKKTWFLFFSYNTLHKPSETTYLPTVETEEELRKCVESMSSFIEEPAMPLLARFEDLREVDKIINGEEPWETDWHKPYVLGLVFDLKRLIISRLAGLGTYDRVYNFVSDYYASHFSDPQYGSNFKARMAEIEELNSLLKNIKPLY